MLSLMELNDLDGGGGVGRVPEENKEMRRKIVAEEWGRLDDVEFTFKRWKRSKDVWVSNAKRIGSRAIPM